MKFEVGSPKALSRLMYCAIVWPAVCTFVLGLFVIVVTTLPTLHYQTFFAIGFTEVLLSIIFVMASGKTLLSLNQAHQNEKNHLREQLGKNSELFELAQQAGQLGAFEFDPIKKTSMLTKELEYLYGVPEGTLKDNYNAWFEMVHPDDRSDIEKFMAETLNTAKEHHSEFRIIRKDKSVRWIQSRAKIFLNEKGLAHRLVGVNIDITEKRNADEQLRMLTNDLRRAVEVRDDFLSIASHELKTPLTTLILQLHILEKYHKEGKATGEQFEKAFASTSNQAKKLTELVDKLFDSTKIKSGKPQLIFDTVDLTALAQEQIDRIMELWRHSKSVITLKSSKAVIATCDRFRIEQIMVNLLTNAMKYGAGKPVKLIVEEEDMWAIIKIKDCGIGIEKSKHDLIFDRYERAVSPRQSSGLGLGLFIVKQNVLSHGGSVEVQSEPGKGAEFKVKIPKAPIDTQAFERQRESAEALAPTL